MSDVNKISNEDLQIIKEFKLNKFINTLEAEKAVLENKIAELQYQNRVLMMYIKYGLTDNFIIDESSGEINSLFPIPKVLVASY